MTSPPPETMKSEISQIRLAQPNDLPHLPAIEKSAAALFRTVPALSWVADGDTMSPDLLSSLCAAQSLWVAMATGANQNIPVAFIAAYPLDNRFYIAELSVLASHQRRGLGVELMAAATEHAVAMGFESVSLRTDREVPWNGPFYMRLGFREVQAWEAGPEHEVKFRKEGEDGFDLERRCVMVKSIGR